MTDRPGSTAPIRASRLRGLLAALVLLAVLVGLGLAPGATRPAAGSAWTTGQENGLGPGRQIQLAPAEAAELTWPQRRFAACGAVDPATGIMYVFGGRAEGAAFHHRDTWALDPGHAGTRPSWRLVTAGGDTGSPPSTRSCSAVFDPVERRLLVFGGWDGVTQRNSVWALDVDSTPATWSVLCDPTSCGQAPTPRRAAQAAYDPGRHRLVLFAGTDGTYRDDLWSLSLGSDPQWARTTPPGPLPPSRGGHSMVLDPGRDQLWVFGGTRPDRDLNDVWRLDLATDTWSVVVPEGCGDCPSPRSGATLVHDTGNDQLVLHAGWEFTSNLYRRDSWALLDLDSQPRWQRLTPDSEEPRRRSFPVAVYHEPAARMLVFGGGEGASALKDTSALLLPTDGSPRWRGLQPGTPLTARDQVAVHYDADDQQLVAFGGFGSGTFPGALDAGTHLADTWLLGLGPDPQWVNGTPADVTTVPLAREAAAYASDHGGNRMLAFGGLTGDTSLADVWVFDGTSDSWSQLCSPTSCGQAPPARWGAHAVYDPTGGGRLVVYGGRSAASTTYGDTWVLEMTPTPTWRLLQPAGPIPAARWGAAAAYDPRHHRLVLFGGQTGPDSAAQVHGDTWTLDLGPEGRWQQVVGPGPSARRSPAYVMRRVVGVPVGRADPLALVVFGGLDPTLGVHHNDVWSLDLRGPAPRWRLDRAGSCAEPAGPVCRRSASAVYDPASDSLVTVFGRDETQFFGDAWRFTFATGTWDPVRSS